MIIFIVITQYHRIYQNTIENKNLLFRIIKKIVLLTFNVNDYLVIYNYAIIYFFSIIIYSITHQL